MAENLGGKQYLFEVSRIGLTKIKIFAETEWHAISKVIGIDGYKYDIKYYKARKINS